MADAGKYKTTAELQDFVLLHKYIRNGEEDKVTDLIDSKYFSKEAWDRLQWCKTQPPLQVAVTLGHVDIVRCLLGRSLDYYGDEMDAPLVEAVRLGHLDIVRALVEEFGYKVTNKVDTQTSSFPGIDKIDSLIILAVRSRNKELVKYLVDAGADINYVGPEGSVLHEIVEFDDQEMCEFILSRGFSQIDAMNSDGYTAFYMAYLFGKSAFIGAPRSSSWSICDALVAHGANVNLGSLHHLNAFSHATRMGDLDTMKHLLGYGADPDMDEDERPIESAVRTNKYTMVHYLAVVLNVPLPEKYTLKSLGTCLTVVPVYRVSDHLSTKILLLKTGCHIGPEVFDSLSNDVTKLSPGEASTYMNEVLSHPRSLADMCCFRIRRVLGKSLPEIVDRLPLPKKLIDFVKLTHVEPVKYIAIFSSYT